MSTNLVHSNEAAKLEKIGRLASGCILLNKQEDEIQTPEWTIG